MNIDEMTQGDRLETLGKLMRLHVGAFKLDGDDDVWCIPLIADQEIGAGCTHAITAYPQVDFQPRKLIILEPTVRLVDRETRTSEQTIDRGWFRKPLKGHTTIVSESERLHKFPRGGWCVRTILVGSKLQAPTSGPLNGDLFGPDSDFSFRDRCVTALAISVCVENVSRMKAPFSAVVLGKADFGFLKAPHKSA
jgi:hypothetical protein